MDMTDSSYILGGKLAVSSIEDDNTSAGSYM